MDVLDELKGYISRFRVRELSDCLTRLGVRTTGNKSHLVDRLTELCDQAHAAGLLTQESEIVRVLVAVHSEMITHRTQEGVRRVRSIVPGMQCLCRNQMESPTSRTVQCVTPGCGCCEHVFCLFPSNRIPAWSEKEHRCIHCRSYFADPFWANPKSIDVVPPTLLPEIHQRLCYGTAQPPTGFKLVSRDFYLDQADLQEVRTTATRLQVVCLQLDDPVLFRFHWPMNCKLSINTKELRVYPRHADNKITEGQRDEPLDISKFIHIGKNTLEISCQDTNQYAYFIQMAKPVSQDDVLAKMHEPENLDAARMRMRRIVRGQVLDDVDDEVQTMTSTMSLRCPFSSKRIKTPARLLNIDSLECVFDLDAFVTMAQKTRKWACPHSLRQSSIHYLAKDVWLERVLKALLRFPEVDEIEVSKEGAWRLRGETKWRGIYNTTVIEKLPESVTAGMAQESTPDQLLNDESEDEAEEFRQAALAAKQAYKKHRQEMSKSQNLEVVDLVSSEGETEVQMPPTHIEPFPAGYAEQLPVQQLPLVSGLGPSTYSRPPASFDFHHSGPFQRAFAEQTGYAFQEPRSDFHPSFSTVQTVSGQWTPTCYRPTATVPTGLPQTHSSVTQYQRRPRDMPFTTNIQTPIPLVAVPRHVKRSNGDQIAFDNGSKQRRVGRLNRRLRRTVVTEQPVPQMECIEIDDSE